jgi:hypothetical protein
MCMWYCVGSDGLWRCAVVVLHCYLSIRNGNSNGKIAPMMIDDTVYNSTVPGRRIV